jgi:hypothetical protein
MSTTSWQQISAARIAVPAHVVMQPYAREAVALNVRTGQYHAIDAIGRRFLEVMREAPDLAAASAALAEIYSQPAERIETDMVAFVERMVDHGLIELVGTPG